MAKKQLRSVKKSNLTGRLDRDAVRSEVITVRDGRNGQGDGCSNALNPGKTEHQHDDTESAGSTARD